MNSIIKQIKTRIELTPSELAALWWSMTDDEQIKFFEELDKIPLKELETQFWYIKDKLKNSNRSKEFINKFIEFFNHD